MGCFDTLVFNCPKCGEECEEQSKAMPDPSLDRFGLADAPNMVLADIEDESNKSRVHCSKCKSELRIKLAVMANVYVHVPKEEKEG